MPLPGDIVSIRSEGAMVSAPTVPIGGRLSFIGFSNGKKVEDNCSLVFSGNNKSDVTISDQTYLRTVDYALDSVGNKFLTDIHYRVYEGTTYLPKGIVYKGVSEISNLFLDWSNAPLLTVPPVVLRQNNIALERIDFVPENINVYVVAIRSKFPYTDSPYLYSFLPAIFSSGATPISEAEPIIVESVYDSRIYEYILMHIKSTNDIYNLYDISNIQNYIIGVYSERNTYPGASPTLNLTFNGTEVNIWEDTEEKPNIISQWMKINAKQHPIKDETTPVEAYCSFSDFSEIGIPKVYTNYRDVVNDHGAGSVVSNLANIALNTYKLPEVVIAGIREDYSALSVYEVIKNLSNIELTFLSVIYPLDNILGSILVDIETLSDKITGQKERYLVLSYGIPITAEGERDFNKTSIAQLLSTLQGTVSKGKRSIFFVPDNNNVAITMWETPTSTITNYNLIYNSIDLTPCIEGTVAIMQYLSTNDPSVPLTEKGLPLFRHIGNFVYSVTELRTLSNAGVSVIIAEDTNTAPYVYRGVTCALPVSIEDGELSISVVEDLMDKENRNYLKKYRGMKATTRNLNVIKTQFEKYVLKSYMDRGWIAAFADLKFWMDETDPTMLHGYYKYRPIYPINKIWIEHEFVI